MKYGYIYKNRPNAQHIISVSKIERWKFSRFKVDFQRNYLDEAEEAVRKNILIQKSRFVAAGNRLADTFELAVNFLADRLDDEIEKLLGVIQPEEGTEEPGLVPFPYSENDVKEISNKLPDEFDWRPRGAVSPVRCKYLADTLSYKVEPKLRIKEGTQSSSSRYAQGPSAPNVSLQALWDSVDWQLLEWKWSVPSANLDQSTIRYYL